MQVGALEAIRVKILIKSEGGQPKTIRVNNRVVTHIHLACCQNRQVSMDWGAVLQVVLSGLQLTYGVCLCVGHRWS